MQDMYFYKKCKLKGIDQFGQLHFEVEREPFEDAEIVEPKKEEIKQVEIQGEKTDEPKV
jgi:hypothetical protein